MDTSKKLPGSAFEGSIETFIHTLCQKYDWLTLPHAQRIAHAYGNRVSYWVDKPQGQFFGTHLTQAEVDYLVDYEWASCAEDILWRRSKLGSGTVPRTTSISERLCDLAQTNTWSLKKMLSVLYKHWKSISVFSLLSFHNMAAHPIIIAHRGRTSGYLPEHTLAAKAMAYAMNADYLEQDLVMTKDNELVVLHDHFLDRVSNVARIYPNRARPDGRFYAIDFTLDELRKLQLTGGFDVTNNQVVANFPKRFSVWKSTFQIHTFAEEIEFIQGLNQSTGRSVGIYPEIKITLVPSKEGKDISLATLETLKKYGYTKDSLVYVQCF